MVFIRKFFFPFSILYFLIISLRNILFDIGILKSKHFNVPLIGIGNLSLGGTGKTPLVEYIFKNFSENFNLSLLSRGYKRSSSGYFKADENSSPSLIGDEPYQILKKFKKIQIAVDQNRVRGVKNLINDFPSLQGIVLDDCFQHRYVSLKLNILLTTYNDPFFKDCMLPSGNLREPRDGYKRADVIIVSKCPKNLESSVMLQFQNSLQLQKHQSLFFTSIQYNDTLIGNSNIQVQKLKGLRILLVTGISNSLPILKYLNDQNIEFDHLDYSDHHEYSINDIKKIETKFPNSIVITTEKDFRKISDLNLKNNLYYLEIKTRFLKNEELFKSLVKKALIN